MSGPAFGDVPDRYDVVFSLDDGTTYGFMLADSVESNLPFRTHKALYSYSPTFLERQNVSNVYGDNFQDFFLTGSQDDFSLGEQQKFFRVNDADRSRRYWLGKSIDPLSVPGQVTCAYAPQSVTLSADPLYGVPSVANPGNFFVGDSTNISLVKADGTVSTLFAHGAGGVRAMCSDGNNIYFAGTTENDIFSFADSPTASSASTFATAITANSIVVNNNILYALDGAILYSLSTSGVFTSQFEWKDAQGNALTAYDPACGKLLAYGGDIFIIRYSGYTAAAELWKYDGSGCEIQAQLPSDFIAHDACVGAGIIFVSGMSQSRPSSFGSGSYRPTIYYFTNGSLGKLWESQFTTSDSNGYPAVTAWGNGILFTDYAKGSVLSYDLSVGGVHSVYEAALDKDILLTGGPTNSLLISQGSTTAYVYPKSTRVYNSSGVVQTSLYDFDNTLAKIFRSVKIDADIPANTSVDIAYQLDDVAGSYATLQTGASSGVEYFLPNGTSGHSISIQVTLNSSDGSATPTVKRVYVRAAPILQQFRKREFLFDLSGGTRDELGMTSRKCRDGTVYPYDPITAAKNLRKIATQTIPFTVQDKFDQYTALADLEQNQEGYDGFALYDVRPNVLIGRLNLREV